VAERSIMRTGALSWEDWRADIGLLRAQGLAYKVEHADYLEQHLEQRPRDQSTVALSLTDGVFLRSCNWARRRLGNLLPPD